MENFGFIKLTPNSSILDTIKNYSDDIPETNAGFPTAFNVPTGNITLEVLKRQQEAPKQGQSGSDIFYNYFKGLVKENKPKVSQPISVTPTKNKKEFIAKYKPYAEKVAKETGIDSTLILSVAGLESGFGKHAPGFNFFGIKGKGPSGKTQTLKTKEQGSGGLYTTSANFRAYDSPEQSFRDFANLLLKNTRYGNVIGKKGKDAAKALSNSGYATDANYYNKLLSVMSGI